ncbi:MAG: glycosyltransferase family A protein [Planctomycetota bacterium]
MPRFSIVIPTFNYAHLVGQAIASCARQSFGDHEVIVVDDGSTDDTKTVVEQAFTDHLGGEGTYVYQENAGLPVARNTGLDRCTGDWVLFFDADDELEPHALQAFEDAIQANPDAVLLFGGYRSVTPREGEAAKIRDNPAASVTDQPIDNFRRFVRGELRGLTPGSAIVRRDIAEAVRFDPKCQRSQDRVFFGQIIASHPVANLPGERGIVVRCLRHGGSLRKNPHRMQQAEPFIVNSLFDAAKLPAEAMAYRNEFAGRYGIDVATNYFRSGWHRESRRAYRRAVATHPPQRWRLRPLWRWVRSTAAMWIGRDRGPKVATDAGAS